LEDQKSTETSNGVFKSLGIDPQAMNARREEKIRAALAEAAASLGIAAPTPVSPLPDETHAPEEAPTQPHAEEQLAPAPPAEAKAAAKAAPGKKMYLLHISGRDFYTTEDSVETIKGAFAEGGVPIVQIMVRMIDERDPKPFQLVVNVNHIAFMRAT
jgi:hypothetical protein